MLFQLGTSRLLSGPQFPPWCLEALSAHAEYWPGAWLMMDLDRVSEDGGWDSGPLVGEGLGQWFARSLGHGAAGWMALGTAEAWWGQALHSYQRELHSHLPWAQVIQA